MLVCRILCCLFNNKNHDSCSSDSMYYNAFHLHFHVDSCFAILLVVTEASLFLILTCRQHIRLKLKSFIYFTLRYITLKLPTFSLLGKTNRKKFCFSFCPFATYTSKTIIQWKTITFGLRHKHTRTNHESTYLLIPELASSFFI